MANPSLDPILFGLANQYLAEMDVAVYSGHNNLKNCENILRRMYRSFGAERSDAAIEAVKKTQELLINDR